MITVRPLKSRTELDAYMDLCIYCFSMSREYAKVYASFVGPNLQNTVGAFDDSRLVACMWYVPYEMNVGGTFLPMGGVAAVATYPEARNLGLAKRLMARAHEQMKSEGRPLSVLAPFKPDFYARMGYAMAFSYNACKLAPEGLKRPLPEGYRLVRVDPDKEWKTFDRLHNEYSARYFGAVKRSHNYWRIRLFDSVIGLRYHYLILRGKEPAGFIITHVDKPVPAYAAEMYRPAHLSVLQAVWTDPEAFNVLLHFIYSHRDQYRTVSWNAPPDLPLHGVGEQLEIVRKPKMMLKIVDLKAALERRPYPSDASGELALHVKADDTSRWNDGVWRLRWHGGQARVTKGKATPRSATVKTDIQSMALLYSGQGEASRLAEVGLLSAARPAMELLERAFPQQPCYIDEWF